MWSDFILGFFCLPLTWLCGMVGIVIYDKVVNYHYAKKIKYEIELYEKTTERDKVEAINKEMNKFIKEKIETKPFTMKFEAEHRDNVTFHVEKENKKEDNKTDNV